MKCYNSWRFLNSDNADVPTSSVSWITLAYYKRLWDFLSVSSSGLIPKTTLTNTSHKPTDVTQYILKNKACTPTWVKQIFSSQFWWGGGGRWIFSRLASGGFFKNYRFVCNYMSKATAVLNLPAVVLRWHEEKDSKLVRRYLFMAKHLSFWIDLP